MALSPDGDEYMTTVNDENGEPFSTSVRPKAAAYTNAVVSDGKATWQETAPMVSG
jgi:hypothetical protein